MSCGCAKHNAGRNPASPPDYSTGAFEPCVFCAEKHFQFARRMCMEYGYTDLNRDDAVGELVAATMHLWKTDHVELAEKLRDIRHALQMRKYDNIGWESARLEMDTIVNAALEKTNE